MYPRRLMERARKEQTSLIVAKTITVGQRRAGTVWGSIEVFVRGVEFRQYENEDFHPPQGAVPHAGSNKDGHAGTHGDALAIEFHLGAGCAFQKIVRLGQPPVIVRPGVG